MQRTKQTTQNVQKQYQVKQPAPTQTSAPAPAQISEPQVLFNEPLISIPEPDPTRFQQAKVFSIHRYPELAGEIDYLAVDSYVDAKDSVNNWCVAQVKNINHEQKTILLNFDGWSSKYDVEVKRNSTKIAPFRTHTIGYTGQSSMAIRDFKFNQTYLAILENKMQQIIESNFRCFDSAFECTQFIRGELYFYVDSLLTLHDRTTKEDLPAILNFMDLYFQLVLKWYELIPSYVQAWRETIITPNLFNVDLSAAISLCCYEITSIMGKLFGIEKRPKNFFLKYKSDYIFQGPHYLQKQVSESGFQASLVNKLGQLDAFAKLVSIAKRTDLPLNLTTQILRDLKYMSVFLEPNFAIEIAKSISDSLNARIQNIQPVELKELDRYVMDRLFNCIENFTKVYNPQKTSGEVSELLELQIALQQLKSSYFELKIRGMNDFKQIFQKVRNSAQYTEEQLRQKDLKFSRYLNSEIFCEFLTKNEVLEIIFSDSSHPELIKRSLEILYLRSTQDKKNPLSEKLIGQIWTCCIEKHEAVSRAAFQILQDLIQYLSPTSLELVWGKVKQLPEQEFDELRVQFLKQYTIGALNCITKHIEAILKEQNQSNQNSSNSSQKSGIQTMFKGGVTQNQTKKIPQINSANYLSLNIFWNIGQEINLSCSQKTKDLAINSLIEILSRVNPVLQNLPSRIDFIRLGLENLKAGTNVQMSLLFIKRVLTTFNIDTQSTTKYSGTTTQNLQLNDQAPRERVIQQLVQEKLFDLILINASKYMKQVKQLPECDLETKVFGNYTHKERIDAVFGLIEFLIVNSKSCNLEFQQVSQLFETFVTSAITTYEREKFFMFLTKENENSATRERKFLLDEKRRTQVFQQIMCNQDILDCSKLGQIGFNCFKLLFLNVNSQHRSLDIDQNGSFLVIKLSSLQGSDTLWHVAILSTDQKVRDEARNFLVDLYLNCKVNEKQKKELTDNFLQRLDIVFSKLNQQEQAVKGNGNWHIQWIKLLSTFIKRFDYDYIQEENLNRYDQSQNIEIAVTLKPHNTTKNVLVNSNMKIWQLIIQSAKAFKMRCSEFRIVTNSGPIEIHVYNHLISQYTIKSIQIQRIDEKILVKENPRHLIAQNAQLIQKMIDCTIQSGKTKQNFENEEVIQETFDLIELLPVNIDNKNLLLNEINKIKIPKVLTQQNVNLLCTLFQVESPIAQQLNYFDKFTPQTCYNFMLLQDLLIDGQISYSSQTKEQIQSDKQIRNEFCIGFIEKGGLNFLVDMFNISSKERLQNCVLLQRIQQTLQKMIIFFFQKYPQHSQKFLTKPILKSFLLQDLSLLQSLCEYIFVSKQIQERDHSSLKMTLDIIQLVIFMDPILVRQIYEFKNFDKTLLIIFTQIRNTRIQEQVSRCFLEICCKVDEKILLEVYQDQGLPISEQFATQLPTFYFMKQILKTMIPATLPNKSETDLTYQLFKFANSILTETEVASALNLIEPVQQIAINLAQMIQDRPILEMQAVSSNQDYVLSGLMSVLRSLLFVKSEAKYNIPDKHKLIHYLLHDCLFLKETNSQVLSRSVASSPKCKTNETRSECLYLIKELCDGFEQGILIFVDYLRDIVFSNNVSWFWRTPRRTDWSITADNKQERSVTGYVGLKNIGCICYMNSIIQQLYMIPSFRKAMLEVWDKNLTNEPTSENCLYQIKRIFASLMQLEKQYYNPKKFCLAFKDIDGSPIDPRVQKDVDEFFNMLIDRIENLIKGTKEEAVMKNLFYGVFANELICNGCPHTSEREEPFMAIQVQVKDKHSVMESLEAFVQGEMLEGDNAYFCDKCDKKRDTLKRCTIKRLPNVLFIELKRFEFNFDTMSKIKLNDYCEFPMDLDMQKYSQEYIKRQDLIREMDDKNLTFDDLDEEQRIIYNKTQCADYFQYSLKGVVVHQGTADSGHYYSFIKEREKNSPQENNWFEFNDKDVLQFDAKNIPMETFGGDDPDFEARIQQFSHDAAMQQVISSQGRAKTRNAYILIYERKQFIDQVRFNEFIDDNSAALLKQGSSYVNLSSQMMAQCSLPDTNSSQIQILPEIQKEIQEKNRRFWLTKYIFNKSFIERSYDIFGQFNLCASQEYQLMRSGEINDIRESEMAVYKFVITFMLTVAIRCNSRICIPYFVKIVRNALQQNVGLSIWLCQIFSCQSVIKEFLIECPIQDMSRFVAGLLATAMQTLYKHEERAIQIYSENLSNLDNYVEKTQKHNIIQTILHQNRKTTSYETNTDIEEPIYTPADQVLVHKLHAATSEIPVLVIMINSFLHYQTSNSYFDNLMVSSQFERVISSFTELGKTACLYLLNTGELLRLLKLILQQKADSSQVIQNVPIFILKTANNIFQRNQTVGIDAKVLQVDRKYAQINATPHHTFAYRSLANMIKYCKTSNQTETNQERSEFYLLERAEIDLIMLEISNRNWWRSSSVEITLARNATSKFWATLCTNDIKLSQIYLKEIFTQMTNNKFDTIKRLERPLLDLLQIKDTYQLERITRVLNSLYESLKKNTQYWKHADSMIELTLKLSIRCQTFAQELYKNKNIVRMIEQITKENPSFPLTQQGIRLFKEGIINWSNIPQSHKFLVTEQKVNQISNYSKQRLTLLQKVLQEQQNAEGYTITDQADSDDDCFDAALKEGDFVDAKFSKKNIVGWSKAKVVLHLDEMVRVQAVTSSGQVDTSTSTYLEKDSQYLMKEGTQTRNEKMQNHYYFLELLKLAEPVSSTETEVSTSSTTSQSHTGVGRV